MYIYCVLLVSDYIVWVNMIQDRTGLRETPFFLQSFLLNSRKLHKKYPLDSMSYKIGHFNRTALKKSSNAKLQIRHTIFAGI